MLAAADGVAQFPEAGVHGIALFAEGLFGALFDGEGGAEFAEEFGRVAFVAAG